MHSVVCSIDHNFATTGNVTMTTVDVVFRFINRILYINERDQERERERERETEADREKRRPRHSPARRSILIFSRNQTCFDVF